MSELKACPFCESEAHNHQEIQAWCTDSTCPNYCVIYGIKVWNQRHYPPEVQAVLEAMDKMVLFNGETEPMHSAYCALYVGERTSSCDCGAAEMWTAWHSVKALKEK